MKDPSFSLLSHDFVTACVSSSLRIDGRSLTDSRRVNLTLGPVWGFAEITFDQTRVVASTLVDAITPPPERRSEGSLSIIVDFSPTSSEPAAKDVLQPRAPPPSLTEARAVVERIVRDSRSLDTEALCILAGIKVWAVRVHVDVVNDDGNCIDACVMAVMASLMHARRPDVTVTGKEVRIHSLDEREPVPLPVHHVPLAVSFALFGGGKLYEEEITVLDPIKMEETASGGSVTFAYNAAGEICGVHKAGGLPLALESFIHCSELAEKRVLQLTGILKEALDSAASKHPLSVVRPMLVHPEPKAWIKSKEEKKDDADMAEVGVGAAWNAVPVADEPPPVMEIESKDDVDGGLETVFEKKEDAQVIDVDDEEEFKEVEKKKIVQEVIEIDSDSSGDDDLENAIISRPRGGSGRRRR